MQVSLVAGNGEPILEKQQELSGETLRCGECVLDKEAYDVCMKMAHSSRLKNAAILMKIKLREMEIALVEQFEVSDPILV